MQFANTLNKLSNGLNKVCKALTVLLLAAMVVVTMAQIIFRFFHALQWSEEVTRYMLVWATFIGASCAYKEGAHISITAIQNFFPPKARKYVQILVHLVCIVLFIAIIYFGWKYAMKQFQLSPALRIPEKYVYTIVPIGFGMMTFHAVNEVVQMIFGKGGRD